MAGYITKERADRLAGIKKVRAAAETIVAMKMELADDEEYVASLRNREPRGGADFVYRFSWDKVISGEGGSTKIRVPRALSRWLTLARIEQMKEVQ